MKTPAYLQKGDKIALVAPARSVSIEELNPAITLFEEWGLQVILGENLFKVHNQFAGTDEERAADFQKMLDDPEIKAVIAARGGYGAVRIIDLLNFENFVQQPKWIVGYSDVTVLHSHVHTRFSIETLHATMPINIFTNPNNESIESLHDTLFGRALSYQIPTAPFSRAGEGRGEIIGGNLSILYSLIGTESDIKTDGKILFIEDLDEYLYHIDRMMQNLKRSGKLNYLSGLIIGGMTEMKDNTIPFGSTAEEIILDIIAEYDYPVCFGFPAGHLDDNRAIIMGRKVKLNVNDELSELIFDKA
ncbi:MAG: LD-carboxypeptidase [Bacteroidota bacterium]|nr:LD-carboxypeptidase [Bacteroidota bacterium]